MANNRGSEDEMIVTPYYDPAKGPMPVIGFMSGSGSNLVKLIEDAQACKLYCFVGIVTDKTYVEGSNTRSISERFEVPFVENPRSEFLRQYACSKFTPQLRREFDRQTLRALSEKGIRAQVAAFGGYMSIASKVLYERLLCVNVHPADLSILGPDGRPAYRGDHAVQLAIDAGEQQLRATTHIVSGEVDCGPKLLISGAVPVDRTKSADDNQGALKKKGDHVIFPLTMQYIATGRFGRDEHGVVCFDGVPKPRGVRLEDVQ